MQRFKFILVTVFALSGCNSATETTVVADRVFLNGAVYTVNPKQPWAEAVAVAAGHIVFVGSSQDAKAYVGADTDVMDLQGQMLLPGFHDVHTHILIGDATDEECNLLRIDSVAAVEARLRECTALAGFGEDKWIIGSGWSDWLWPKSEPNKAILDELFPDRPVYLGSSFGHNAWVNSRALELAGIHAESRAGPDGIIVRDPETGEATGALHDAANQIVQNVMPPFTVEYELKRVRTAIDMAHRFGVTAIIEPGLDAGLFEPVLSLYDSGELDLRVVASVSPINWQPGAFDDGVFEFLEQREQWRRPNIDVDSVKIYIDGVPETGTGALLEPYDDASLGVGPRFYAQEKLNEYFTRFDALGLQIHVHATGDAGIRMVLDGFQAMRAANGVSGNRHHMAHLQLIHADDIPRFGQMDIGATFQALWAYPDPPAIELDIPMLGEERTNQMYPIGSVHRAGGRINGGSDYFVTSMNPLLAIEVGLTRQNPYTNRGDILNVDERVDLATMLEAYTINGAYTMKLEHEQGSIEVGKRADLTVLNQNLFDLDPYAISDAYVTMTVFDGRTVYKRTE
ncbi:MAG: amidohydrolase [Proteobacteria bacterium]|nr:amidohydrolase [Pseudomonadota bacterium]MDA1063681.1 amidohydrolase [Pseudomonadota bacterium]